MNNFVGISIVLCLCVTTISLYELAGAKARLMRVEAERISCEMNRK